ncbi:ECF transporter S component [Breznakiella homolactica]|uniref:ECF transporter S component n=1 Tax=Breznakiella homolactica TaxID=2798577 RepID=A0A7T7XLP2_9SPIR|nr:ECF transporter S component [Breznakiella homolactica]QQO08577.1 ECF transporter S component [Breznakiella homolactica]
MASSRVRKIATAGVLSAVIIVLGITRLGFIPWFSGASVTIMHIPVIIGAILEGPVVGAFIGLLFGVFSLIQAATAPLGVMDVAFVNPLISVLPRLFIGPVAWLLYRAISGGKKRGAAPGQENAQPWIVLESVAIAVAAVAGTLVNTALVLSGLGFFGFFPWPLVLAAALANGPAEAAVAAVITIAIVLAWKRIPGRIGRSKLSREASAPPETKSGGTS